MILPKRGTSLAVLVVVFVCFVAIMNTRLNPIVSLSMALSRKPEVVIPFTTHVVLFQFKEGTSAITVKEITSKMLALKKTCVHPNTRRPYILSITGGKDISTENLQNGISHAFILQFYSNEDRDYYVDNDPVHQAFKDAAAAVVEKTIVVDFQEGVFTHVN